MFLFINIIETKKEDITPLFKFYLNGLVNGGFLKTTIQFVFLETT
jgi:hypothetical protein